MISYIKGRIIHTDSESIIMENHGIGYQIKTPSHLSAEVQTGQEATIHTYLYVREDQLSLFGFLTKEELTTFQVLLSVNGIGPKAALSILSTLRVEDLYYAVFSEDVKQISKTPGIGPKGAKRIIIELKDKLHLEDLGLGDDGEADSGDVVTIFEENSISETMEALIALGYSNGDAYRAVHGVSHGEQMDSEQLLKEALKVIVTLR